MKYGREILERALISKGYKYFINGDYNLNIIGIRNSKTENMVTNRFDDTITLSYKINGEWQYHEFDCTTDPGTHWVKNVMNDKGVAILKPGQYPKSYRIGKHQGKYEALCQQNPVTVYRDNNRDDIYNLNTEKTDTGLFGINIHRATEKAGNKSTKIDKWSAGCQVIASNNDWTKFIKICKKAKDTWSNNFTYTLITSNETNKTKTWI